MIGFLYAVASLFASGIAAQTFRDVDTRISQNRDDSKEAKSTHEPALRRPKESIDFSRFSPGDVIHNLGNGISVYAWKWTSKENVEAKAMIFDSSTPSGGDEHLGTPNKSFGGPGVGSEGAAGKLFMNKKPQNNVLIISENEKSSNPDDNALGGYLQFVFSPPRYIDSIGLLNNADGAVIYTLTIDEKAKATRVTVVANQNGGKNSYERVAIGKASVKAIEVNLKGEGAITDIFLKNACSSNALLDFEGKNLRGVVERVGSYSITAEGKDGKRAYATIFDTSSPGQKFTDFGTPHQTFGGPGIGYGGQKGKPLANRSPKGNALVITNNGKSIETKGSLAFTSRSHNYVDSIGVLNNTGGVVIVVHTADGGKSEFQITKGGDNSFELVAIGKPGVIKITVDFYGKGAITEINTCA